MSSDPNRQGQYPPPQWENQPQRGAYPLPPQPPPANYRVRPSHSRLTRPSRTSRSVVLTLFILRAGSSTSTRLRELPIDSRRDGDSPSTAASSSSPRHVSNASGTYVRPVSTRPTGPPASSYAVSYPARSSTTDGHRLPILQTSEGKRNPNETIS